MSDLVLTTAGPAELGRTSGKEEGQFPPPQILSDLEAKSVPSNDILCCYPSVQPKPGFDIENQKQGPISVLEPNFFFRNRKFFVSIFFQASNFSHFCPLLGEIQVFISLKINLALRK